ncbi:MAG: hypothetical protein KHY27_08200, partial [Butyricicoccus pullicaecorum]|nr:hypothetical protein [Butyricicoccus pullicaecorum]
YGLAPEKKPGGQKKYLHGYRKHISHDKTSIRYVASVCQGEKPERQVKSDRKSGKFGAKGDICEKGVKTRKKGVKRETGTETAVCTICLWLVYADGKSQKETHAIGRKLCIIPDRGSDALRLRPYDNRSPKHPDPNVLFWRNYDTGKTACACAGQGTPFGTHL